jgi:hypothetical protein
VIHLPITDVVPGGTVTTISLAALNVIQAIALAYIAARWRNGKRS